MPGKRHLIAEYRRAGRFLLPYRWRLLWILLTGAAASSFGLAQPYITKLLIDEALLRRDREFARRRIVELNVAHVGVADSDGGSEQLIES